MKQLMCRASLFVVVLTSLAIGPAPFHAQAAQPAQGQAGQGQAGAARNPDQWEATIRKFEDQDKLAPPPQNAIVFIGAPSTSAGSYPKRSRSLGRRRSIADRRLAGGRLHALRRSDRDSLQTADRGVLRLRQRRRSESPA